MDVKDWDTAAIAAYAFDLMYDAVVPNEEGVVDYSQPTVHRLKSDGREFVFTSIADLEDKSLYDMYAGHLKAGDCILHAGAYCGVQTVDFSHCVGANGRVLAFEPDREAFQALNANVARHALNNVDLRQQGLWKEASTLSFFATAGMNASFTNAPSHASVIYEVVTTTADEAVASASVDIRRVALFKIDVEGAELAVLQGAKRLLAEGAPTVFIDVHLHADSKLDAKVEQLLLSHGYRVQWVGPNLGPSMKFCLAKKSQESLA